MYEQKLPMLPPSFELETKAVLKQLARANRVLAELKGYADTIPNKHILINAVIINGSKDGSAIESIHPFYDCNGRTGRIINILYLGLKKLLDSPILYLSSYIIRNKSAYYRLLQEVRTSEKWEEWIVYILTGIEEMSEETLKLVKKIND
jgi:Fic family protein